MVTLGAGGNSRSSLGFLLRSQVGPPSRPRFLTHTGKEDVLPCGVCGLPCWILQLFNLDVWNPDWHLKADTLRIVLRTPETDEELWPCLC